MLTTDRYGKSLSNTFISKTTSIAQKIKPLVIIHWLDSRHLDKDGNTAVAVSNAEFAATSNSDITNEAYGLLSNSRSLTSKELDYNKARRSDFYFTPNESVNGFERESFSWAVAGAKDKDGKVITANGRWHCLPSTKDDNYEFGFWSSTKSTSNVHATLNGYEFTTAVTLTYNFVARPINRIKIVTSEKYGQIKAYNIKAYRNTSTLVFNENAEIADDNYYFIHYLDGITNNDINKVLLTIYTTKNSVDCARIQEVNLIYESDMSDYVIDVTVDKVRDLHESSLPIAGTSASTSSITLDNTNKDFNLFSSSSTYGKYMKKDLKVYIYGGWQIQKSSNSVISTVLSSSMTTSSNTISVATTNNFPDGGGSNNYIISIDADNSSREYILCSKNNANSFTVIERGYNDTIAKAHNSNATVSFDTFEYVPYGVFYVNEWQGSSGSMQVSAQLADWQKFAAEKIVNNGFLMQDTTVAQGVEHLLLRTNFPQANISYLQKPSITYPKNGAILHLGFDEKITDRENKTREIANSLRARFVEVLNNDLQKRVKDIMLDANDRDLSVLEKALDVKYFFTPALTTKSTTISTQDQGSTVALNFTTGTWTKDDGSTSVSEYYNGVFDGFYVPSTSGNQKIVIDIKRGGVKVYLNKILIINKWYVIESGTGTPVTIESALYNLTAGKAYELRIEFFTDASKTGDPFVIKLKKDTGSQSFILASEVYTMAALDRLGSKDDQEYLTFDSGTGRWTVAAAQNTIERAARRNNGIYKGTLTIGESSGIVSDTDSRSVLLDGNSYIRVPYHSSFNIFSNTSHNYTGDTTITCYVKFHNGSFANDGEYISVWNNASSNSGFELYYNANSHGLKIVTSSGTETISSNVSLSNSAFSLLTFTLSDSILKYYVDGVLQNTVTLAGTPLSFANKDLTIGGRGASYSGGEVAPSANRSLYIDEFAIFNKTLNATQIKNDYIETKIQPLLTIPFIFGNEQSIQQIINDISLSDLGRLYIDESENARYEHYYRLWESTIDQHANVQQTFSDSTNIIEASYNVQLQVNKVIVKLKGVASNRSALQGLWQAEDPTTLGIVSLASNLANNATTILVNTTDSPAFPKSGYLMIDDEVVKYSNISSNAFLEVERAQFNTFATSHNTSSTVREAKYYNIQFDKAPAFKIKSPLITAAQDLEPALAQIVKYEPNPYGANLVVAASTSALPGSLVYLQGQDVITNSRFFAAIAGVAIETQDVRGEVQEKKVVLDDNIRKYGLKELIIENDFITTLEQANAFASFIINKASDPVPVIELTVTPTPRLQLGDRIRISSFDAFDIINGDYWVVQSQSQFGTSSSQQITIRKVS